MSNDKTAEEFLKEKGIIKEGYSKWICRFEDGKEFDIGELIRDYSAQQLKEYREVIRELLPYVNNRISVDLPDWERKLESLMSLLNRANKLIDQTDTK